MKTIEPLFSNVLVKPRPDLIEEVVRDSKIVLMNQKKEEKIAVVLAVGPGYLMDNGTLCPMPVAPDDVIQYASAYNGYPCTLDGEELLMLKIEDILGIVREVK